MESTYVCRLEMVRRVAFPFLGKGAYTNKYRTKVFSFGAGGEFKTWKDAKIAALEHALKLRGEYSRASVSRLSSAGNGFTQEVAPDIGATFPTNWPTDPGE